ncbi:MAG: T9SS type A sorting domain-containing protein, partial [Bacteroidetes bacterium]|nr:T9SS type A sorting domain-containing protein [Bacteroidota bacterium]
KNGMDYSIDRLSSLDENSVVAIGIKAGLTATYTLDATGVDNFFFAKSIILEDLKTGSTQELKNNASYTFTANPGDASERFHLHFGGSFGIDCQGKQPDFTIFSSGNSVFVKSVSDRNPDGIIYICNILGQKIIQQRIVDQSNMISLDVRTGCYIVTVVTSNRTYSRKVFIH